MKETIQNHFSRYRLSEGQLRRLRDIQTGPRWSFSRRVSRRIMAASVVLSIILVGLFWWPHHLYQVVGWSPWNQQTSLTSLASEIAYHHNKQMVMEVESSSLETVRGYLSKLDFPLIESKRFPSTEWKLVGGRYCALKGHLAAQLRMRDRRTGKACTFYQLLAPQNLSDFEGTFEDFEQGVKVEIWKERGLLLGVAQEN